MQRLRRRELCSPACWQHVLLLCPRSGCPCLQHGAAARWGVRLPRAEAGAGAGSWVCASEGVSVSPKLLPQAGVLQDICFLQVMAILWQQMADGQSRCCGRCVCSAIAAAVILHQRVVEWFYFVKKMNGKRGVMSMLKKDSEEKKCICALTCHLKTHRISSLPKIFV